VHQNAIMSTDIPAYLIRCLQPAFHADVRVAALWGVINLGWQVNLKTSHPVHPGHTNPESYEPTS
jgi:hypothetical protein